MASFVLEEFVGNGVLRDQMDSLTADGWSDVPTLKMMSKADMDTLQLSELQRDALELRTYLHDRLLMTYADTLEASGKNLNELLNKSPTELTNEFKMRRGHVARFLDRGSACGVQMPSNLVLPARKLTAAHRTSKNAPSFGSKPVQTGSLASEPETPMPPMTPRTTPTTPKPRFDQIHNSFGHRDMSPHNPSVSFMARMGGDGRRPSSSMAPDPSEFKPPVLLKPTGGGGPAAGTQEVQVSKGIFSAPAAEPRCCGLVRPAGVKDEVTPLAVLEKIMVRKIAPAHSSKGANPFREANKKSGLVPLPPPFKASDLWADQPTLILCLRRPGCVMCRAEAHQLYTRKPIFDAMGIRMVVCLNEHLDAEVRSFWPRYWGGMVVVDEARAFFRALGQGKLAREGLVAGFVFNAASRANYKRAAATGVEGTLAGEGTIKGGMYIVRPGNQGVAYQFVERNFGDWAPLDEVLQVCSDLMQSASPQQQVLCTHACSLERQTIYCKLHFKNYARFSI